MAPQLRIAFAFIYGSVARAEELATSDVDLMVVGDVGVGELALPLRKVRERLAREVNVSAYSKEEFVGKARAGHRFVRSVLDKPKLFVVSTESELERAIGTVASRAERGEEGGARGAPSTRAAKSRRRAS